MRARETRESRCTFGSGARSDIGTSLGNAEHRSILADAQREVTSDA